MAHQTNIIVPHVQQTYGQTEGVWSRETAGDAGGGHEMTLDSAFKLTVEEGGMVKATFPFHGDPEGSQLSFQIGDTIKVLQRDELWSWGQLMRTGEEGYFPHNYVQGTFKPLPGMHELQMKMAIKKARAEAIERGEDPDKAEAAIISAASGEQNQDSNSEVPFQTPFDDFPVSKTPPLAQDNMGMFSDNMNQNFNNSYATTYDYSMQQQQQQQQQFLGPNGSLDYSQYGQQNGMVNGGYGGYTGGSDGAFGGYTGGSEGAFGGYTGGNEGGYGGRNEGYGTGGNGGDSWSNAGEVDMAFGMWVDYIDGGHEPILPPAKVEKETSSPADAGTDRRRLRRQKLMKELLASEEGYVGALEALLDTVIRPCLGDDGRQARFPPITHGEAEQMFGGLHAGDILRLNTNLRNELRGRLKHLDDHTCVGDVFTKFSPSLRSYADYCLHHETAASQLSLLANNNESFRSLLKRSKADPRTQRRDAQELMGLPKKRIPEYKAALENLLRYTDTSHPDHPLLTKALDDLNDIANFIEEGAQWRLNQSRMAAMKSKLVDPPHDLCRPGRIFLRSGVLNKLGKYLDRADLFVLFNDGLLQAKPQTFGNKFLFKRIVNVLRVELVGTLQGKAKALYPFRIVTDAHIFLLTATSSEQRIAWMKALTQVIKCGTRQLIHKGPLGMLKLEKDPVEVREEYFYVFSDVVVRGRALWRDKFKHMQTLDVTRIEENYHPSEQLFYAGGMPSSLGQGALELCFRIMHIEGSMVLMAPTMAEKEQWIKALYKQQDHKRDDAVRSVAAARQPASQDLFANGSDSDDDTVKSKSSHVSNSAASKSNSTGRRASLSGSSTPARQNSGIKQKPQKDVEIDLLGLSLEETSFEPSRRGSTGGSNIGVTDFLTSSSQAPNFSTSQQPSKHTGPTQGLLDMDLAKLFASPPVMPLGQVHQSSFMQGQQFVQGGYTGGNLQSLSMYQVGNSYPQQGPITGNPGQYPAASQGQGRPQNPQQAYNTQQQPGYYPSSQGW